jgi:hypothetical protein
MSYSTAESIGKLTGEAWLKDEDSGIISEMIDIAFNDVKAGVKRAGLTPPISDDTLKVAEINLVIAELIRRGRFTKSLAIAGLSLDTYDNINKAIDLHRKIAKEKISEYVYYVSEVAPSDTGGQSRVDLTGTQFKLDQGTVSGFE